MATHVYFSYGSTIKDPIRAAITHTSLFAELIAMTHLFSWRNLVPRSLVVEADYSWRIEFTTSRSTLPQ